MFRAQQIEKMYMTICVHKLVIIVNTLCCVCAVTIAPGKSFQAVDKLNSSYIFWIYFGFWL